MARPKKAPATRTTVIIERHNILKEYCILEKYSFRELLNEAISDFVLLEADEYFNLRYFKGMAKRR
jgi:hypothetical protein